MFTGLVHECGRLSADPITLTSGAARLAIEHSQRLADRLSPGASLACSGVCLTVTSTDQQLSRVELSPETLARTTLGGLHAGSTLNLEPAMLAGEPLGGHWVQGHVDCTVAVVDRRDLGDEGHRELAFELPEDFRAMIAEKGSVTLDGVSLTVSRLFSDRFEVALIPHTLSMTNLDQLQPGDRVNFEVDVLAKYVQRALAVTGMVAP